MTNKQSIHEELGGLCRSLPVKLSRDTRAKILASGMKILGSSAEDSMSFSGFTLERWAASSDDHSSSDEDLLSKIDNNDGTLSLEGRKSIVGDDGNVTVQINDEETLKKFQGKFVEVYNPKTNDIIASAYVESNGRIQSSHDSWDEFRAMFKKYIDISVREKK